MMHFSKEEWRNYCKNLLGKNIRFEMEEHLLNCEECLETYVSILELNELENSKDIKEVIPSNFADKVLNSINQSHNSKYSTLKNKNFSNTIIYYVAAASITLFFLYNGFFNILIDNLSSNTSQLITSTSKFEDLMSNGWSERLMNKTSNIIDTLISKK